MAVIKRSSELAESWRCRRRETH